MGSRPPAHAVIGAVVLYAIALATCGIAWDLGMPWLWLVTVIAGIWASVLLTAPGIPLARIPDDDLMAVADATREPPLLPDHWTSHDWDQVEAELARANTHRNPGKGLDHG